MVRNLARLVALAAIVAVAAGVYVIVHANVATNSSSSTHSSDGHHHGRRAHRHRVATHAKPKFYTVQSGDTLSDIASRTGVSLTTLETLNPSLNPNALQTGQRLRLRR